MHVTLSVWQRMLAQPHVPALVHTSHPISLVELYLRTCCSDHFLLGCWSLRVPVKLSPHLVSTTWTTAHAVWRGAVLEIVLTRELPAKHVLLRLRQQLDLLRCSSVQPCNIYLVCRASCLLWSPPSRICLAVSQPT